MRPKGKILVLERERRGAGLRAGGGVSLSAGWDREITDWGLTHDWASIPVPPLIPPHWAMLIVDQ